MPVKIWVSLHFPAVWQVSVYNFILISFRLIMDLKKKNQFFCNCFQGNRFVSISMKQTYFSFIIFYYYLFFCCCCCENLQNQKFRCAKIKMFYSKDRTITKIQHPITERLRDVARIVLVMPNVTQGNLLVLWFLCLWCTLAGDLTRNLLHLKHRIPLHYVGVSWLTQAVAFMTNISLSISEN